jgi:UDP-N-acetylglucosamine--N-acetylmuramyl-(pentapeptide) pyrophosphoryl-undecaprenol N-acetylglucosamine transferase
MEAELVQRTGLKFEAIPAAGVHGVGLRALPGNLLKLLQGLLESRRILRRFRPDALLFTGGYVAVPMALAARLPLLGFRRPRSLVYIPDIEPGLALKVLLRFADHAALTVEVARAFLPDRLAATTTGYPLRPDLKHWERNQARQVLGLSPSTASTPLPVLLVTGGSQGARSINQALLQGLPKLLESMEVIHLSGRLDWPEVEQVSRALPGELAGRYHPYPYLHEEMGAALSAADLVISRAGASCLGEYPFFGTPAILVPYPYAWRYQRVNAEYLVKHGAALLLPDDQLGDKLIDSVLNLVQDQPRRQAMHKAMLSLSQPQAAGAIAGILSKLAESA